MTKSNHITAGLVLFCVAIFTITAWGSEESNADMSAQTFNWEGKWEIPHNDHAHFSIHLNKQKGDLEGWHCYTSISKIDCAEDDDITLSNFEAINNKVIEGDFKTSYSNIGTSDEKTGRVQLKIINSDTIQWWLKEPPTAVPPTPIPSKKIELTRVH